MLCGGTVEAKCMRETSCRRHNGYNGGHDVRPTAWMPTCYADELDVKRTIKCYTDDSGYNGS